MFTISFGAVAQAQREQATPEYKTKIDEVKSKGKIKIMVITDEAGKQHDLTITPKVNFTIRSGGDQGFIRKGLYVQAKGVLTNKTFFIKNIDVFVLPKNKKPPAGRITKAARQSGASTSTYDISGIIVDSAPSEDYEGYVQLALKVSGKNGPIMLEKGFRVNVVQVDPALLEAGQNVTVQATPLRGGRLNLVSATVTLSEPLKSEEVFPAEEEK